MLLKDFRVRIDLNCWILLMSPQITLGESFRNRIVRNGLWMAGDSSLENFWEAPCHWIILLYWWHWIMEDQALFCSEVQQDGVIPKEISMAEFGRSGSLLPQLFCSWFPFDLIEPARHQRIWASRQEPFKITLRILIWSKISRNWIWMLEEMKSSILMLVSTWRWMNDLNTWTFNLRILERLWCHFVSNEMHSI